MNELKLIETLKAMCPQHAGVILGIDDDASALVSSQRETLVCTDMLMDGTHFHLNAAGPQAVGYKALAVNLSDIAAMGGEARSAFVSLAIPKAQASESFITSLYYGMSALALDFQVAIAGGDTNIWNGPLVISVTVLGEAHAKGFVRRSGAKPGDKVFVTGPLGGSIEGHHLTFTPRLAEAKLLMDEFTLHSMIDVSDGLAKDLAEISRQSRVAVELDRAKIPLRSVLQNHPEALKKALCDGEDFELCFTLSAEEAGRLERDSRFSFCIAIGEVKDGLGLYWRGESEAITWQGFEHGDVP